ncbi:MAG: ferritin-like domain-containing protein [Bacteroidota bacterium]
MQRKTFIKHLPLLGLGAVATSACTTTVGNEELESEALTGDLAVLRANAELEAVAVETYLFINESPILPVDSILETTQLYKDHHYQHLQDLNQVLLNAGGVAVDHPQFLPDQRLSDLNSSSTVQDVIRLAVQIELEAATAYLRQSIDELTSREARLLMAEIYPIEVSHFVELNQALGNTPAINSHRFSGLTLR